MKTFVNKIKYPLILFGSLTLICGFIFLPYLLSNTEFVLGWDMRTLYSSNFEGLRNFLHSCLENKELPFWSWHSFLGNDYYSSKLFYFQDIFDYPFALTNLNYYTIIKIQTYLKFITAGFTFYAYARFNKYHEKTAIIGALMFAFSAYGLQTMMHPFFGSFYVFLPLYFLTVDNYIYHHKYLGYIFITFFLLINNYYLFYSVSIFTILYFIYRYYCHHGKIKGFMLDALPLIGCYFVGILLSSFALVPEALAILANERVGAASSILTYDSIIPYLNYIVSLFIPTSILANRDSAISAIYSYVSSNESVMAIFLWASSILFLLIPQIFNDKKHRSINAISLFIISLFALIPFLSSFMHGFSEPSFRWLQSPTFFLIILILPLVENMELISSPKLTKTLYIAIGIILFSTPLTALLSGHNFANMFKEYLLLIPFIFTAIFTYFALIKHNVTLTTIALLIELSICSLFSYYYCPFFSSFDKHTMQQIHHVLLNENDFNNYMLTLEPDNQDDFYRVYVDPSSVYWDMSINLNLDFNIMGLLAYDSTYNATVNDLKRLDDIEAYLPWTFDIRDASIMNLVNTKYAIVTDESQVPFANYTYVTDFNYFKVYQNNDYYN
ncbi:MAG: YfhO family protein, partial [Erysipelotrichaceae bacterium]|nr:YfhO family protein [Erysipelotrichaceae bacterium]